MKLQRTAALALSLAFTGCANLISAAHTSHFIGIENGCSGLVIEKLKPTDRQLNFTIRYQEKPGHFPTMNYRLSDGHSRVITICANEGELVDHIAEHEESIRMASERNKRGFESSVERRASIAFMKLNAHQQTEVRREALIKQAHAEETERQATDAKNNAEEMAALEKALASLRAYNAAKKPTVK